MELLGGSGADPSTRQRFAPSLHGMRTLDQQACDQILRSHSRTFYLASLLLAPRKRRGARALYAFCRLADDMVDDVADRGMKASQARVRLALHRRDMESAFHGRPATAVFRELAWTIQEFDVSREPLVELLDGVALDLDECRYPDWPALERYCHGVASSVGEMCTYVWGVRADASLATAIAHARTLGTAMQLTNILRDVGEDAARGRCYLPEEELAAFGFTSSDVLARRVLDRPREWSSVVARLVVRARQLYDSANAGIPLLSVDGQRCASACSLGYSGILDALAEHGYDNLTRRATVGWGHRGRVLARAWFGPPIPGVQRDTSNRLEKGSSLSMSQGAGE